MAHFLDKDGLSRFYAGLKTKFIRTINGSGPDSNGNFQLSIASLSEARDYFSYPITTRDWVDVVSGEWFTDYIPATDIGLDSVEILDRIVITGVTRGDDSSIFPTGGYYFGIRTWMHSLNISDPMPDRVRFYYNGPAKPSDTWVVSGYVVHDETGNNSAFYVKGSESGYPIGAIYSSTAPTSPALLYGGTWERIEGRFLLGATDSGQTGTSLTNTASVAPGSTGGEAAHTLSGAESGQKALTIGGGGHTHGVGYRSKGGTGSSRQGPYGQSDSNAGNVSTSNTSHSHTVSESSASQPHNNMPPFIAIYMWQRIG